MNCIKSGCNFSKMCDMLCYDRGSEQQQQSQQLIIPRVKRWRGPLVFYLFFFFFFSALSLCSVHHSSPSSPSFFFFFSSLCCLRLSQFTHKLFMLSGPSLRGRNSLTDRRQQPNRREQADPRRFIATTSNCTNRLPEATS